jgi:hypothetical protein
MRTHPAPKADSVERRHGEVGRTWQHAHKEGTDEQ